MWTRAQLKQNGLFHFKKNYWMCVLAALLLMLVGGVMAGGGGINFNFNGSDFEAELQEAVEEAPDTFGAAMALVGGILAIVFLIIGVFGILLSIFVFKPLEVGGKRFFVANHYQEKTELGELAFGFKANYGNVVKTMFLKNLFVFLWSLLFVIPGIVKMYAYRMVPYLLTEHPDMDANEALALSQNMMNGQKMNAFVLDLSFIGWEILSAITFGLVGIFYVNPYKAATDTELYIALKETGAGGYMQQ